MISNAAMTIRPGSMGRPLPGIEVAIVWRVGEDAVEVVQAPDVEGERPQAWLAVYVPGPGTGSALPQVFCEWLVSELGIWPDGMPTATSGSSGVPMTSSRPPGTWWAPSRWRAPHGASMAEAGVIGKPDPVIGELVKACVPQTEGTAG